MYSWRSLCQQYKSSISYNKYKTINGNMIHKKAFRKKSLKLYTSPDEEKLQNPPNLVDYLSSSYNKNRYSADIFSHLKQHD
jgi:hypothetical protein